MIYEVLAEAKKKFGFSLYFFTVMGNHLHKKIQVSGQAQDISKIMHWINFTIAMRYNKLTGHEGRLWRERFKSKVIEDWNYFINCAAYIARNPERAGIASALEYRFGSAIFLYKNKHPLQEFEQYRYLCTEPYSGYFEQVKQFVEIQSRAEARCQGLSMAPGPIGRPKNVAK